MITGWLSPEDCPDCGGPLLDASTGDRLLVLACPGCGYRATWHATDPDDLGELGELGDRGSPGDLADPEAMEAE